MLRHSTPLMTLSRRSFVAKVSTTAAALPLVIPKNVHGQLATKKRSVSDKLNIASIAVGGRGWTDANGASQGHNLVAFCDVMTEASSRKGGYTEAAKHWPKARRYQDWRKLLDESKDIDAITVSTPDHMHAAPTLAAMFLFSFVFHYSDYFWPLMMTTDERVRTLPLAVALLREQGTGIRWHIVMAGNVVLSLPVLLLFALTQRRIMRAVSARVGAA